MREFLRELRCAVIGHPGLWVAELDDATFSTIAPVTNGITLGRFAKVPGELRPWRCAWCRRTLADIGRDYAVVPDWLKELGW